MRNVYLSENLYKRDQALLVILALIIGGVAYTLIPMAKAKYHPPLTLTVGCRECHKPVVPAIKNITEYKEYHRKKKSAKALKISEQLKSEEYLVSQLIGGEK